jgi:hypothetical protein
MLAIAIPLWNRYQQFRRPAYAFVGMLYHDVSCRALGYCAGHLVGECSRRRKVRSRGLQQASIPLVARSVRDSITLQDLT